MRDTLEDVAVATGSTLAVATALLPPPFSGAARPSSEVRGRKDEGRGMGGTSEDGSMVGGWGGVTGEGKGGQAKRLVKRRSKKRHGTSQK